MLAVCIQTHLVVCCVFFFHCTLDVFCVLALLYLLVVNITIPAGTHHVKLSQFCVLHFCLGVHGYAGCWTVMLVSSGTNTPAKC
jgi:hypothetical protein